MRAFDPCRELAAVFAVIILPCASCVYLSAANTSRGKTRTPYYNISPLSRRSINGRSGRPTGDDRFEPNETIGRKIAVRTVSVSPAHVGQLRYRVRCAHCVCAGFCHIADHPETCRNGRMEGDSISV